MIDIMKHPITSRTVSERVARCAFLQHFSTFAIQNKGNGKCFYFHKRFVFSFCCKGKLFCFFAQNWTFTISERRKKYFISLSFAVCKCSSFSFFRFFRYFCTKCFAVFFFIFFFFARVIHGKIFFHTLISKYRSEAALKNFLWKPITLWIKHLNAIAQHIYIYIEFFPLKTKSNDWHSLLPSHFLTLFLSFSLTNRLT